MTPSPEQLEAGLWRDGPSQTVWAILDGARDPRIWAQLHDSSMIHSCLYSGKISDDLKRAAPYLVRLAYREEQSEALIRDGWGNSWGIFFRSRATLDTLRRHFRQFLLVQDPRGRRLVFRYYDPRVLRAYFPTCLGHELRALFGPVECFCVEDAHSDTLIEFRFDGIGLTRKQLVLASSAS